MWFVFELVIWPQEVTLARWTQPSGPLCLWQCFIYPYPYYPYIHIIHIHNHTSILLLVFAMGSRRTCGLLWSSVPLGPLYHGCHDNDELVFKITNLLLFGIIIPSICAIEDIATIYATANSTLGVDLRKVLLMQVSILAQLEQVQQRMEVGAKERSLSACHLPKGLERCFVLNTQQFRLEKCHWLKLS